MFVYIYKLIKKDAINDDMIYIGSTEDIKDRMRKHKCSCNNINDYRYNCKVYKYIRDNGGWDEWKYEIIDEVEVALRNDARIYEGEYIIKYDAINKLNDRVAGRTNKEYKKQNYQRNKEDILQKSKEKYHQNKEQKKEYYQQNKEQIKQKYQQNKEQINQNYQQNKEQIKQYYQQNKEQIKQKNKEYQNKNKDDINERRRELRRLAKLNKL